MTEDIQALDPKTWPSIDLAYAFVLPSYQLLASRFEAADNRIVSLITMAASVALAGPVLGRAIAPQICFTSPWLISSMVAAGIVTILGLFARITGALILPNPRIVRETALWKPEWRFKADALYIAGLHFDQNADAINMKGNWSIALTILIGLEVGLLVTWIARHASTF